MHEEIKNLNETLIHLRRFPNMYKNTALLESYVLNRKKKLRESKKDYKNSQLFDNMIKHIVQ